jgi:hypothetical protein
MLAVDDFGRRYGMNCEEFATAGLDLDSVGPGGPLQKAARDHLRECPHCAAFHENWLTLREDLRELGAETTGAETPNRVEMRLREEFNAKHKAARKHHGTVILGWSLAAAATLFFAVTGANWYRHKGTGALSGVTSSASSREDSSALSKGSTTTGSEVGDVLVASNDSGDFTLLPDSMPPVSEDATVVRVQMQRAALGAFGLTVNEEHAGDWIQVDLLVGDDGSPEAVRLPPTTTEASN